MTGKSSRTETFVIEGVILSFPHLFALDNNGKYSAALLVNEQQAQMIYAKAQELAASHFVNNEAALPQFRWPVVAANTKMNSQGAYIYADNPRTASLYVISSSAQPDRQPQVLDENHQMMLDRRIKAGDIVAVGISLFTYNQKGNIGVGCGLQAVMKQAEGESLGGEAVDATSLFAGVQGQPTAPAAPAAAFPGQPAAPAVPAAPAFAQNGDPMTNPATGQLPPAAPAAPAFAPPGAPAAPVAQPGAVPQQPAPPAQPQFGAPETPAAPGMPPAPFPPQ